MIRTKVKGFINKKSPASVAILAAIAILAVIAIFIIIGGLALMTGLTGNNSGDMTVASGGQSLSCPPGLDINAAGQCLDSYMKSVVPSSPLIGQGITFAKSGKQYNVNPALMVAIGKQESSLGTKGIVLSNPYNYYGMTKAGGGWASYSSWEESITNHARYLRENYLNENLDTIAQIGAKYAPTRNATNDPNGLNNHWVSGVSSAFDAIIAKCPALSVTATTGSKDIVQIAISQLGVKESGGKDCGPPTKYTGGKCLPWCAAFTTWVYQQAGYDSPNIYGAYALYDWFEKNQITFPRGSGTPQPGDIILFSYSHIGIVEYYSDGVVHTIEGNTGSKQVARQTHNINSDTIVGFGRWKK